MLALQESFHVRSEKLSLSDGALGADIFFGDGHAVSAAVFGGVHAGIGHPDDLVRRGAVDRKTGYSKAAGDASFAEHGIGRDPESQTLGQDLGLLHARFRHQDHELVTTVTSDDVRLARLLLEQPADARQYQVTLQVAQGVIHVFELVEIDQDYGERAARPRRTLPFRLQSL